MDEEDRIHEKFRWLAPLMNERLMRIWAATEARSLGRGGAAIVERATGIRGKRIFAGMSELEVAEKDVASSSIPSRMAPSSRPTSTSQADAAPSRASTPTSTTSSPTPSAPRARSSPPTGASPGSPRRAPGARGFRGPGPPAESPSSDSGLTPRAAFRTTSSGTMIPTWDGTSRRTPSISSEGSIFM